MQGWIKLNRELFESDIWNDVTTFRLFILLIAKASHQDGVKTKGMVINRGQYVRSYRKLAEDLSYKEGRGFKKYSLSTIMKCVNKLIESERVNVKETELGTLFTIVNYSKYQDFNDIEQKTTNTINEEVKTNCELTANEVRTNCEQEQELKHLSTKELDISSSNMVDLNLAEVIKFYESNFGIIPSSLNETIPDDYDRYGKDLMIEAMNRSVLANKRSYGYVLGILKNWASKNAKTIEDVQALEVEFDNQKMKGNQSFGRRTKEEKVPDWLQKQKADRAANNVVEDSVTPEFEELKRELLEKLGLKQ